MKKFLLVCVGLLFAMSAKANYQWDNYLPDNTNVQLTSTNLPIVFIDVNGAIIDRDERITARMKIIYNGPGQLNYADTVAHPNQEIDYDGYVAIKYRGNSSFTNSDKKPYSFRPLDKPLEEGGKKQKVKILGMGKDNDWAMLAPYSDRSMLRDLLAFELSRPWMDFAPHGKYCEMILDGTYYGIYIMIELVSKGKSRLNLDDPGEEGDALTGGYLVEVDRNDEITFTSNYHPVSSTGQSYNYYNIYFQYKAPEYEDMTEVQVSYIQNRVHTMENVLYNSYYSDAGDPYADYIDVKSFIDYQLAQEFGHNVDGYRLSCKLFKQRDSIDSRFKLALWDMNLAYGNADYYGGYRTDNWIYQNNNTLYWNGDSQMAPFWWYKLNKDAKYTQELKTRWGQYRRANFRDDRLMALVDSLANELTSNGAMNRNSQAWPRWGQYIWPNYHVPTSYADEISFLKGWLNDRLAWMDQQLDYDPTAVVHGDVNNDGIVDIDDVNAVINIILKVKTVDDYEGNADLNDDNTIDVDDMNAIINIILTN